MARNTTKAESGERNSSLSVRATSSLTERFFFGDVEVMDVEKIGDPGAVHRWLTTREAAGYMNVSTSHVRKLIEARKLRAKNISSTRDGVEWRICVDEIRKFLGESVQA